MEDERIDSIARVLGERMFRRRVAPGLAAILGLHLGRVSPGPAHAAKKKKKLARNAFGCVPVGKPCAGKDGVCCSGICDGKKPKKGKKDKSRCAGHDATTCRPGQNSCVEPVTCTTSTGFAGSCFTTTGDAGYCARGSACHYCATDAECVSVLGPGAACVLCATTCNGNIPGATLCKGLNPD
jgi:hypothetical protein